MGEQDVQRVACGMGDPQQRYHHLELEGVGLAHRRQHRADVQSEGAQRQDDGDRPGAAALEGQQQSQYTAANDEDSTGYRARGNPRGVEERKHQGSQRRCSPPKPRPGQCQQQTAQGTQPGNGPRRGIEHGDIPGLCD